MSRDTLLVADLFCGAGGSSTGARRAIDAAGKRMELVAVNHWATAIATHSANHPDARHVIEDVNKVDPSDIVEEGYLDLLMASPECTFFSRARGGKPIHDQGRMDAWTVHNWLTKLDVQNVLIENVSEFTNWGPLNNDQKPIEAEKGKFFEAWFMTFLNLGYTAEWKMLNAANYGDATTRTRFFLIAHKGNRPVIWPEPTHAKADSPLFPGRLPWRPAREIIDWSNLGRSILDDPKYQKRPLAKNTLKRISRGLSRYGGPLAPLYIRLLDLEEDAEAGSAHTSPQPFILNRHGENGYERCHSIEDPLPTATCRGSGHIVLPRMSPFMCANRHANEPKGMEEPIPCITTAYGGGCMLVLPEAHPFVLGQQSGAVARDVNEPIPTIATAGIIRLVTPFITHFYKSSVGQSADDPLSCVTAKGRKHGIVDPMLVEFYSNSDTASIHEPLRTVTTKDRHGLACPTIIELAHGNGKRGDRDNDRRAHSVDEPLGSITTSPGLGLSYPIVMKFSQTKSNGAYSRSVNEPLATITTKNDTTLVVPVVEAYVNQAVHNAIDTEIDPRRIVMIDGQPFLLDIRFRMLDNTELARAMGFDDEVQKYEFVGNKTQITKQIGNAVPVNLAAALVKSILVSEGRDDATCNPR